MDLANDVNRNGWIVFGWSSPWCLVQTTDASPFAMWSKSWPLLIYVSIEFDSRFFVLAQQGWCAIIVYSSITYHIWCRTSLMHVCATALCSYAFESHLHITANTIAWIERLPFWCRSKRSRLIFDNFCRKSSSFCHRHRWLTTLTLQFKVRAKYMRMEKFKVSWAVTTFPIAACHIRAASRSRCVASTSIPTLCAHSGHRRYIIIMNS